MAVSGIEIFSDGACSGNPGPGAYGTIMTFKSHRKELTEAFKHTTNNRMELMGVIAGLEAIKEEGNEVTCTTDSKYVVESIEKGWVFNWMKIGFKGKKNEDLWRRLIKAYSRQKVKMKWIKGHNGHVMNEFCDKLAVASCQNGPWLVDAGCTS